VSQVGTVTAIRERVLLPAADERDIPGHRGAGQDRDRDTPTIAGGAGP